MQKPYISKTPNKIKQHQQKQKFLYAIKEIFLKAICRVINGSRAL